jgi:O-antigen ligase
MLVANLDQETAKMDSNSRWISIIIYSVVFGRVTLGFSDRAIDLFWSDIAVFIAMVAYFTFNPNARKRFHKSGIEVFVAVYFLTILLSYPKALDAYKYFAWIKICLFQLFVFYLGYNLTSSIDSIYRIGISVLPVVAVIAIQSISNLMSLSAISSSIDKNAFSTEYGRNNYLASLFVIGIVFGVGFLYLKGLDRFKRILITCAVMFLVMSVVLASSRGGIVASLAGVLFFWTFFNFFGQATRSRLTLKVFILPLVIVLSGVLIWFAAPESLKDDWFFRSTDGLIDSGNIKRLESWNFAWNSFLEQPFLGIGLSNQLAVQLDEIGVDSTTHNIFLQVLVELGILGFSAFFGILLYSFIVMSKYLNRLSILDHNHRVLVAICMSIFAASMVNSLYEPSFWGPQYTAIFWLILGSCVKAIRLQSYAKLEPISQICQPGIISHD